jgi:hypothetical protein
VSLTIGLPPTGDIGSPVSLAIGRVPTEERVLR